MSIGKKLLITLTILGAWALVLQVPMAEKPCFGQNTGGTIQSTKGTEKKAVSTRKSRKPVDPYAKEVKKTGKVIVISKTFADLVKKDNTVVLSKVAIQQRLSASGEVAGYELVSIDRGSAVEKTGARPHDLITSVNGIPARDFAANRALLESCSRFDITIVRKGRPRLWSSRFDKIISR